MHYYQPISQCSVVGRLAIAHMRAFDMEERVWIPDTIDSDGGQVTVYL